MRKGLIATGVVVLIGGVAAVLYSKSNAGQARTISRPSR